MKIFLTSIVLCFCQLLSFAQLNSGARILQEHARKDSTTIDSTQHSRSLYMLNGFNYLQPLRISLKGFDPAKTRKGMGNYSMLANDFAYAGDYASAALFGAMEYDSMPVAGYADAAHYLDTLKNISFNNARKYILSQAAKRQVVMLNETRYLPEHRAFTMSLLKDLYALGFRYLATDLLNNRSDRHLTEIDMRTGYYAAEPVAGEMLRKALSLGYSLLAYEDTLSDNHSGTGRDAIQAARIASLLQKDPAAKILVLAGQAHIAEDAIGKSYIPMAVAFRRFTAIDPFTIDQTELSPGSTFEYGRYFYSLLQKRLPAEPTIAFRDKEPVSLLENELYDVQVIHPPAVQVYNRPQWLNLGGERKQFAVRPTEKSLFLVQAYYLKETNEKQLGYLVPADQTYLLDQNGYYSLFLYPGKYTLVNRDLDYKILSQKEIEVPL